jgi:hypothetical protein
MAAAWSTPPISNPIEQMVLGLVSHDVRRVPLGTASTIVVERDAEQDRRDEPPVT